MLCRPLPKPVFTTNVNNIFLSQNLIFPGRLICLLAITRNKAHTSMLLQRSEGTANHLKRCACTCSPIAGGLRRDTILIGPPGFIEPGSHLLHCWVRLRACPLFQVLAYHA